MNVVFDLGGVVFTWQPEHIIKSLFNDNETREKVRTDIFSHPDWLALDRGSLEVKEAIERGAIRTQLSREVIARLMQNFPAFVVPIEDTVELIHSVKSKGNKAFVLSNMHFATIEHLEREYPIWDLFDGTVISCRINMVKPEAAIFEYLLDKFDLIPNETIFIDDMEANVMAAAKQGINPIKFEDAGQCEIALKKIGCI